jgi:hypothetical protein
MSQRIKLPRSRSEAEAASIVYRTMDRGARAVATQFTEPDDDWDPVWLAATQTYGVILAPGDIDKLDMVESVAVIARKMGAVAVGHVHSSWAVLADDVGEQRMREIQQHMETHDGSTEGLPERTEVVMLAVHTASRSNIRLAPIQRTTTAPPTLGPWRTFPSGGGVTGAMVDPLRRALHRLG